MAAGRGSLHASSRGRSALPMLLTGCLFGQKSMKTSAKGNKTFLKFETSTENKITREGLCKQLKEH